MLLGRALSCGWLPSQNQWDLDLQLHFNQPGKVSLKRAAQMLALFKNEL